MEKQNPIPADQPGLYDGTHCVSAGMRQFHLGGDADFGGVGVGSAGGSVSHLLETGPADAATSGHGWTAF
ncbi:hypothetical protein EfsSVR2330_18720 [Enterococcus faecalis]|nr:hypothetical protein EfsSVR2330_18720 [Enterococcus faecalis]